MIYTGKRYPDRLGWDILKTCMVYIIMTTVPEIWKGYKMGVIRRCIKGIIQSFLRSTNRKPCPPFLGADRLKKLDEEIPRVFLQENIKNIHISRSEFDEFEKRFHFEEVYDKYWARYQRKVCEYFAVDKILSFSGRRSEPYVYIDAMASSSIWASDVSQEYGVKAYSVDLNEPPNPTGCFVKADVTKLPFEDASVDAISVQSGVELLPGEDDIRFMKEVQRVLKPKGKCVILPLYLNPEFCNLYGRSYYQEKAARDVGGAVSYVRLDYDLPFTRLYDLNSLEKRLLETTDNRSCWYLYIIDADDSISLNDNRDSFIYLRYVLVYEKE